MDSLSVSSDCSPLIAAGNARGSRPKALELWGGGLAGAVLATCVGFALLGHAFNEWCTGVALANYYHGCFNAGNFLGVVLITVGVPASALCAGRLIVALGVSQPWLGSRATAAGLLGVAALALATQVVAWVVMIKPADYQVPLVADPLWVQIAGFLVPLSTVITLAALAACTNALGLTTLGKRSSDGRVHDDAFSRHAPRIALLVVFFVYIFWQDAALSSIWNFSLGYSWNYVSDSRTAIAQPTADWLGKGYILRVYEDFVWYWSWLGLLILGGTAAHFVPSARRALHRRVRVPLLPARESWWNPYPRGATVGELAVVSSSLGLVVVWIWFWRYRYERIVSECEDVQTLENLPQMQIWARVLGHVGTLSLSFVALPLPRDSLWESCFGIPFERALKYHRGAGALAYVATTLHMALWWAKWLAQPADVDDPSSNLFVQNLNWVNTYMSPVSAKDDDWSGAHFDNFTILLAEFAWLGLSASLYLALRRRANYRAFQWVHRAAGVLYFGVAVVHGWSNHYYTSGPLLLWLIDWGLRVLRAARCHTASSFEALQGEVTELVLPRSALDFYAGQYAFLCVPQVSPSEWHPFTISSAPHESLVRFHIKDMGPGTWTRRLRELAATPGGALPVVSADGPYGRTGYYADANALLLVAGGIGVTPLHSVFADLKARIALGELPGLRHVRLVWSARDARVLRLFEDSFGGDDRVRKFVTGGAVGAAIEAGGVRRGRPDLRAEFLDARAAAGVGGKCMALVCGPPALVAAVSELSFAHKFSFHAEEFFF